MTYAANSSQAKYPDAWTNLRGCYDPILVGNTGGLVDDVSGNGFHADPQGGAYWVTASGAPAIALGAAGDYFAHATPIAIPAGADVTFFWRGTIASYTFGNPSFWRSGTGSGDTSGPSFNILNDATWRPWIRWNGADVLKPTTGYQVPVGSEVLLAYRCISAGEKSFWAEGSKQHYASNASVTPTSSIYVVGYQYATSQFVRGIWRRWAFWTRALSDAEMAAMTTPESDWFPTTLASASFSGVSRSRLVNSGSLAVRRSRGGLYRA